MVAGLVEGFVTPSGQALGPSRRSASGSASLFWAGVFWLGRPRRAGVRARAPRLQPQVGADARFAQPAGGASITTAPDAAQSRRDPRARIEHVERDRGAVDVARRSRARATTASSQVGIGDRRDDDRVPAGEHRHRREQRTRGRLVDEVGEHDDEPALAAADRSEREVVVAVDEPRFDVEDRLHDRAPAAAPRS